MSFSIEPVSGGLKLKDFKLIEQLRSIWQKHQADTIRTRHTIGKLLNERLGPPANRQRYGGAIMEAAANELGTDKTNICRFRRFADKFADYDGFFIEYPQVKSWTQVREMLKQSRQSASGNRRAWGLVRSLKAAVESLRQSRPLESKRAAEVSVLLEELFDAANRRDDVCIPAHDEVSRLDPQLALT
jgi:hypothetical protein